MKRGFTLLEMVLVMAVMGVVAAGVVPAYRGLQIRNDMDIAVFSTVQSLRRAQVLAQAVDSDSQWGVKIVSPNIALFKGSTYFGRDTAYDELFDLPSDVSVSGVTEVVFNKVFGDTANSGSINFSSTNSDSATVTVNSKGAVDY